MAKPITSVKQAQAAVANMFPDSTAALIQKRGSAQSVSGISSVPVAQSRTANAFPDTTKAGVAPIKERAFPLSTTKNVGEEWTENVTATGGTRTFTFAGQTTSALAYNASAGTIQTALEALSNIAPGDVVVQQSGAYKNVIQFAGVYINLNVSNITVDGTSLTGGTSTLTKTAESISETIAREKTEIKLAERGLARKPGTVSNDVEKLRKRVPVDIGQVGRIPGEDFGIIA